jgi:predicted dehydrogenase
VAMIGCGARAHELMQAIQQNPGTEIVAVVDAYRGRVERAIGRTKGQAKAFRDYQEVLARKDIDAAVIVTPDHLHARMVIDTVRAGKDVYCEKPLTWRASEGVEIVRAVRETGRMVQVGSQGVSTQLEAKAKEMIRSGRLGKVTLIRAAFNRNTASGAWVYPIPPDASPSTVNWEMFLGSAPRHPFSLERFFRWRCFEDYSGGIATDLFVHLSTAIHYMMDSGMPSSVMAMGQLYRWKDGRDVPDTLNALLEYPEGFAVNLSSTFNNQLSAESGFQVLGTEGSLTIGGAGLTFYPENVVEDNRWIVESWPKALQEAYYRDPKVIQAEIEPAKKPKPEPKVFQEQGPEATTAHFAHFFESMRTRKPYWEDAVQGHHAAACAHLINLSARQRRAVEWDFSKDDIKA